MTLNVPDGLMRWVGAALVGVLLLGGGFLAGRHSAGVGCPAPKPPEPPPPGPGPTPGPTPAPAPIPAAGLRVLVVYETADLSAMPRPQLNVLYAKEVRDYLDAHCAKGPDGKTAEYRFFDKDAVLTGESAVWRDAMARPRKSVPWILVSNGRAGFEGPLPPDVPSFLALVKQYE